MSKVAYVHDKELDIHKIIVKYARDFGDKRTFTTEMGSVTIHSVASNTIRTFYITVNDIAQKELHAFKTCTVFDEAGNFLIANPLNFKNSNDRKNPTITLTTQDFRKINEKRTSTFLEEMYNEAKHCDVTFDFPDTSADIQRTSNITEELECDQPSSTTDDKEDVVGKQTLVAHKAILIQWPYFRTMLESGFAEGGQRPTQITAKDTSIDTFKILLRYMYTVTIPEDMMPEQVYDNPLNNSKFSWEQIYLAADRYDIAGLRDEAENRLIDSLDEKNSTDFLFRTAYMFEDLRSSVIDYIAENCGQLFISNHDSVDMFKDHPEFASIICEMYTALYEYHVED
ncbi:hypothetical protein BGZ94_003030 [Podila epigama]|nr:hypothetical protein BGZ94_003030 [Podila epigama]